MAESVAALDAAEHMQELLAEQPRAAFSRLASGDLRFADGAGRVCLVSVLEADVVRVRFWPSGAPDAHAMRTWAIAACAGGDEDDAERLDGLPRHELETRRTFSRPALAIDAAPDGTLVTVRTSALVLRIALQPLAISWHDADTDALFAADHALVGYNEQSARAGAGFAHTMRRFEGERYLGLGDKSGPLDRASRRLIVRATDAFGYDAERSDPLYKHCPLVYVQGGVGSGDAAPRYYGMLYDTSYEAVYDLGCEIDNYYGDFRRFACAAPDCDYWLWRAPSLAQCVARFTWLCGRPPLAPYWTLGPLNAGMRYLEGPDPASDLAQFLAQLRVHDVPCTGFHFGSGYTKADDGKRYVFEWHTPRFSDPAALVERFRAAGVQVLANVKPGVLTTHPRFAEVRPLLIRHAEREAPDLAAFWGGAGGQLDFTNTATVAWWRANLSQRILSAGVAAVWNDNNEYNVRADCARCNGFGTAVPLAACRPVQATLMAMASRLALRDGAPAARPFVLTRAGGIGCHRVAGTWTGDNRTSWHTLKFNIAQGLSLSLCGWANVGHDVGGFAGADGPDAELWLRWVQSCALLPRFAVNTWRMSGIEPAPWAHADVLPEVRAALRLRMALRPLLYTLLAEASFGTGLPPLRPIALAFPSHTAAVELDSFCFALGDVLLVAPVFEAGSRSRTLRLPGGVAWRCWHTNERYASDAGVVSLAAPLARLPLLVREGALVPTRVQGAWVLHVFAAAGRAAGRLYIDDGMSRAAGRWVELCALLADDGAALDLCVADDWDALFVPCYGEPAGRVLLAVDEACEHVRGAAHMRALHVLPDDISTDLAALQRPGTKYFELHRASTGNQATA